MPVEEVFEEMIAEVELNPQVVAVLSEESLMRFHKILLAEDAAGTAFYRETTYYTDELPSVEVFGPFFDASEALWGIGLV